MEELIRDASEATGAERRQVEEAIAVFADFLADSCTAETLEGLRAQAPALAARLPARPKPKGFFGALMGGKAALVALWPRLQRAGMGSRELEVLVPMVLDWLGGQVDDDLWARLRRELPSVLFERAGR